MKFLLDTNILIPLEPTGMADVSLNMDKATELFRLAHEAGHMLFRHPTVKWDLHRDKDTQRAAMLNRRLERYPALPDPPPITARLTDIIGVADHASNDWVDDHLLAALSANAVDLVVSEDKGIRAKARRLGIGDRVLTLLEAITTVGRPFLATPPPAVKAVRAHALPEADPIFNSFREDYPGFDAWFAKCRLDHRQAWKIDGESNRLAAICIVKPEGDTGMRLGSSVLKICSFKVSTEFGGYRYGELLLKAVFQHAHQCNLSGLYVTVLDKHSLLVELFEDFGFERQPHRTPLGELVLSKPLVPDASIDLRGLAFHLRYGPPRFDPRAAWHIVPIKPQYSDVLFPETASTRLLFEGQFAFGNAIRKAYLCHSPSHQLRRV